MIRKSFMIIDKTESVIQWPEKYNLCGVKVSATDYDETVSLILKAAKLRQSSVVSCHAVHAIISASLDNQLLDQVNSFELIVPDGQPVRWALNRLYQTNLSDRVYGPELTVRLSRKAAEQGVPIYLYGSSSDVIKLLCSTLISKFPGLQIAGAESPPFRPLTQDESESMVKRINDSEAGIVFVGLGCPKQDQFASEYKHRLKAVQVCVGAAFDFIAGTKEMAPSWMQQRGLEWLFRLSEEPRRLLRRYLVTNFRFIQKLLIQWGRQKILIIWMN